MNLKGYYVDCSDMSFEYPHIFFIPTDVWITAHDSEEPPTSIPGVKNRDYAMSFLPRHPLVARTALEKLQDKKINEKEFMEIADRLVKATDSKYALDVGYIAVGYKEQDMAVLFRLMLD